MDTLHVYAATAYISIISQSMLSILCLLPMFQNLTNSLELRTRSEIFPGDDQQCGQVNACVLIGLSVKSLPVPTTQDIGTRRDGQHITIS